MNKLNNQQGDKIGDDRDSRFIVGRQDIREARLDMISGRKGEPMGKKDEPMILGAVEKYMLPAANVVTVGPEMPLLHAREIIGEQATDSLPVLEDWHLLGVLTLDSIERYLPDYTLGMLPDIEPLDQETILMVVNDVMNHNPITIAPQTSIKEAAELMLGEKVDLIPVIDQEETFLGIIRLVDILHMIARS